MSVYDYVYEITKSLKRNSLFVMAYENEKEQTLDDKKAFQNTVRLYSCIETGCMLQTMATFQISSKEEMFDLLLSCHYEMKKRIQEDTKEMKSKKIHDFFFLLSDGNAFPNLWFGIKLFVYLVEYTSIPYHVFESLKEEEEEQEEEEEKEL